MFSHMNILQRVKSLNIVWYQQLLFSFLINSAELDIQKKNWNLIGKFPLSASSKKSLKIDYAVFTIPQRKRLEKRDN